MIIYSNRITNSQNSLPNDESFIYGWKTNSQGQAPLKFQFKQQINPSPLMDRIQRP